jgi:hypothetical protein
MTFLAINYIDRGAGGRAWRLVSLGCLAATRASSTAPEQGNFVDTLFCALSNKFGEHVEKAKR